MIRTIYLSALLACAVLFGCAGSEGGGDATTGTVDHSLVVKTPRADDVVAVRDGDGPWVAVARMSGQYRTDVVDASGRYTVAVLSPSDPSNNQPINIYNLTTRDTRVLDLNIDYHTPPKR